VIEVLKRRETNNPLNGRLILQTLNKHRDDIRSFSVRRMGLFGSGLKGAIRPRSDLDFLVTFDQPTFDNYMGLKFMLERLFRKRIDLVMEENLKKQLAHVREEAKYVEGL